MRRRIGLAAGLLASTFWLAGCAYLQNTGPCYGFGCRAGLMTPHGQGQQNARVKPANAKAFAPLAKNGAASTNAPKQGN
ncbi:MAG: hypothetical protein ABR953_07010 [Candidatus Acidiferrales bacterium]|jgi:hypothetical protein